MKEQIKTKWRGDSQKSDAEFKTLVIRMLTEMIEYSHKIKEKTKAIQSETKENIQEPTVQGKNRSSDQWFGTKERNKHPIRTEEETRIQKNEERLRNLWLEL